MHSFIIYSATEIQRRNLLCKKVAKILNEDVINISPLEKISDPDITLLKPKNSIGIDEIRNLKYTLSVKPFSRDVKIAIILSAQSLTPEAQNALLKTLEEPTPSTFLFLELKNPYLLLPTIRSRCQLIKVPFQRQLKKDDPQPDTHKLLQTLSQSSIGNKFAKLNYLTNKDQACQTLKSLLLLIHDLLPKNPSLNQAAKYTDRSLKALEANINIRLLLEHFAINFPTSTNSKSEVSPA